MFSIRTDLAEELRTHAMGGKSSEPEGVRYTERTVGNIRISTVDILNKNGEALLGKPKGRYVTLTHGGMDTFSPGGFWTVCDLIAAELRALCKDIRSVLVLGLGNEALAADAVGVIAASHVLPTHGIRVEEEAWFDGSGLFDVSVLTPSVLMKTGMASAALVRFAVDHLRPDAVIAVDSLVASECARLAKTVQISDAGIIPGSGVGMKKDALTRETLGIPVIAIGVPTAIDTATLIGGEMKKAGLSSAAPSSFSGFFVTPKEIDAIVSSAGRLIGCAVNRAFQTAFSREEILLLGE